MLHETRSNQFPDAIFVQVLLDCVSSTVGVKLKHYLEYHLAL